MLKGALLIGVAVIVGIFLLNRVDDTKSAATPTTSKPKTTTTARQAGATTTTTPPTTVPSTPAKTPDQLRLIVLNGGAASGKANTMRTSLVQAGYTNQPQANNWSGHKQTGNSVLCKSGFSREAVALSQQTALQGSKVEPFPTPAPPFSSDVDCVVVVGS
jgi:hypothetical protein